MEDINNANTNPNNTNHNESSQVNVDLTATITNNDESKLQLQNRDSEIIGDDWAEFDELDEIRRLPNITYDEDN